MKNSHPADSDPLKRHGVVYRILCPTNGCNHSYIGITTTKLSKMLAVYLQEWNFHQHYVRHHGAFQRPLLFQSTTIIDRDEDKRRLRLREALHILRLKPTLNVTQETFLLPTNVRRNRPTNNENILAEGVTIRASEGPAAAKIPENPAEIPEDRAAPEHPIPLRRSARLGDLAADNLLIRVQNPSRI